MIAVDTNVLIYVHDPRDAAKQNLAISTIESIEDGVLLWQVACEYLSASRKLVQFGYLQDAAWRDVRDLMQIWTTILPSVSVLDTAERLLGHFSLSYWDAMIIGACLEGNVERLYSEDFTDNPRIEGLEIINPFAR